MIRYALHCDNGHQFESWFQDSAAYDKQVKRKLVTCPACGSAKIDKTIMAPNLSVTAKKRRAVAPASERAEQAAATSDTAATLPVASPQERELRAKLKELRDSLTSKADHVGAKFPEEARKMHYGETEHRSIYGEASPDEARKLAEEGVEFFPLPILPDDRN